jgi:hypothetical protein
LRISAGSGGGSVAQPLKNGVTAKNVTNGNPDTVGAKIAKDRACTRRDAIECFAERA